MDFVIELGTTAVEYSYVYTQPRVQEQLFDSQDESSANCMNFVIKLGTSTRVHILKHGSYNLSRVLSAAIDRMKSSYFRRCASKTTPISVLNYNTSTQGGQYWQPTCPISYPRL